MFDGNPASIKALRNKKAEGVLRNVEIIQGDLIEYKDDQRYHLVLCEGLIPWQVENGVEWHYIEPGKPMQDGFLSFSSKLRDVVP